MLLLQSFTAHSSLFKAYNYLFTVHGSLFTAHGSSITAAHGSLKNMVLYLLLYISRTQLFIYSTLSLPTALWLLGQSVASHTVWVW